VSGTDVHPAERSRLALNDIRAILLDIEGTTTPIEFVHQVLFPYARARVHDYLEQGDIALLRAEYAAEPPNPDLPAWNPEAYVYWLMDRDRKSTALKALQGRIWEAGYRAGELKGKGEVYSDVRPARALARRRQDDCDFLVGQRAGTAQSFRQYHRRRPLAVSVRLLRHDDRTKA